MYYNWYVPRTVPRTAKKPKVSPYRQRQKRMKEKTPSPAKAYHDHLMAAVRKNYCNGTYDEIRKHKEDFRIYLGAMRKMSRLLYRSGSANFYPGVFLGMNKAFVKECFQRHQENYYAYVQMKAGNPERSVLRMKTRNTIIIHGDTV